MTNNKIKKAILWIGGSIFVLFLVLLVHIVVMVKKMPQPVNATIQLARADFRQPVDSVAANQIQKKVEEVKGVKSTYFNVKDDILIYSFDNKLTNAQNIYDEAIKNCGYVSERYVVKAEDLGKGCPAINNHSFFGKITQIVASVIN